MYIISDEVVSNCFTNVCSVFVTVFYVLYTSEQSNRNAKPVFTSSCFFPSRSNRLFCLAATHLYHFVAHGQRGFAAELLVMVLFPDPFTPERFRQRREHVLFFMRTVFGNG